MYPTLSYISHSCVCNSRYKMSQNHEISIRAQTEMKKGEEITIQYVSFMYGNQKRKKNIRNTWYFDCQCIRCIDDTELNTFISAIKCFMCQNGFCTPENSSDLDSDWICLECKQIQSNKEAKSVLDFCFEKLFEYNNEPDVMKYETLLKILLEKLHPNHYISKSVIETHTFAIFDY